MRINNTAAAVMAIMGLLSFSALADSGTQAGSTKLSGKAYFDLTHIEQKSDSSKVDPTGFGVDVKRFYLTVDHVFNDMWSADLTTDFNYVSNDSETQLYVKKAYVQARFSEAVAVRAGSADLPWVPFVEHLYGYRYVENTLIDRLKFGTSADWGVHAGGKLANGMVSYAVSAINGNGYKNPSRTKTVDLTGRIGIEPIDGLTLAAAYYTGKLGQDLQTGASTRDAHRWDAVIAYMQPMFTAGAEYFNAENWKTSNNNAVLSANPTDKADGYSLWATVKPREKLAVFARYDHAKPNKDTASSLKDTYYNAGISYQAYKNVDFALVYKHEKVENGTISTSNGSIGGTNDGSYDEIGIWSQVKF